MISLTSPKLNISLVWSQAELDFMEKNKDAKPANIFSLSKLCSPKVVHQIFARQQVKSKLSFLHDNAQIVYPKTLSLEQSSSTLTAQFKATLFEGNNFIDLSGGLGIDAYFMAKKFKEGIILEKNEELAKVVSHNFFLLKQMNVQFGIGTDALDFLEQYAERCDLIYIDPARRNVDGSKIVKFTDCDPNVIELMPLLLIKSSCILIKASPLLDIKAACEELKHVKNVYIIAIDNEVKELLFHLEQKHIGDYCIHSIHFEKGKEWKFSFLANDERQASAQIAEIGKYLYEPNAAILKSGGFKSIGHSYQLNKLHTHTHLYTSDKQIHDFPGRSFEVLGITKVDKKNLQQFIPNKIANVSIRNFPGSVHDVRKQLGLKDGGELYVFAATDHLNNKVIVIAKKLKVQVKAGLFIECHQRKQA